MSPEKMRKTVELYKPDQFEETSSGRAGAREPRTEDIQTRVQLMEKEGFEKGYTAGFQKGLQEGEGALRSKVQQIEALISELQNLRKKIIHDASDEAVALSLDIAKKVINKEIELDRNMIFSIAQEAIDKVSEKEESILIKVNPLDYEVMIANSALLKERSGIKNISIEPVSTISPGGCYIETQTGEIDARIEEQIKEVENVINTALDREM